MIRVDGRFFYRVGTRVHPLANLEHGVSANRATYLLYFARVEVESLLRYRFFNIRLCLERGNELLKAIDDLQADIERMENRDAPLPAYDVYMIKDIAEKFENVLTSELGMLDLYFVHEKSGYDTYKLLEQGMAFFPADLDQKVPEAVFDATQACRCLALEVATSCGFHLHRAHEAVLRKYWDIVTNGAALPKQPSMGAILGELRRRRKGGAKVKATLAQIKDHHRNPIIHPEDTLDVPQANALMGLIIASMTYMLEAIPAPPQNALTAPASISTP